MENKVVIIVGILGLVLIVGVYPQQTNAQQKCNSGPVCGGNGGLGGIGEHGGTCTTDNCNANRGGGNGGSGGNANGGQGQNGVNGAGAFPCVGGHRTLTSSDGRTVRSQAC